MPRGEVNVNDQAQVNRLVERMGGRFSYIPGLRLWLREVAGELTPFAGTAALLGEYVDMIAESGGTLAAAEQVLATWSTTQRNILWLLERDNRLTRRLSDFPPHKLRHFWRNPLKQGAPSDPTLLESDNSRLLFRAYFPEEPDRLGTFCAEALLGEGEKTGTHAHACVREKLFLRTVRQATDPDPLYDFLAASFGELVCRLPKPLWTHWPERLTPEWALRLTGVRMLFLDGCDKPREFAPESLRRLVMRETADWLGFDGVVYSLPLPEYFVLTGPPVSLEDLDADLRPLAMEARPLWTPHHPEEMEKP